MSICNKYMPATRRVVNEIIHISKLQVKIRQRAANSARRHVETQCKARELWLRYDLRKSELRSLLSEEEKALLGNRCWNG